MADATCSIGGCSGAVRARGWCTKHYQRWKVKGDPLLLKQRPKGHRNECAVDECTKTAKSRGWCEAHVRRWRKYGDPTAGVRRPRGTVPAALQAAATATTDECVILDGYAFRPNVRHEGRWTNAARAVWVIAHSDPGDAFVLHTCNGGAGDHGCINIRHLYLGDARRNAADTVTAGRTMRGRADLLGEDNGNAVLTEERVREVRRRYVRGASREHPGSAFALALEFGVTRSAIYRAVRGDTWTTA